MPRHVMAIDAGTTGITVLIVDEDGSIASRAYREFPQHFPRPGWVEHDPDDIWAATTDAMGEALEGIGGAASLAAIGITNQRETTVVWGRKDLRPVHNAIVWQCRRSADICEELKASGFEQDARERTGLLLDPYFSGTKLTWLHREIEGFTTRAGAGEIAFGTVDSWLIANLTGGRTHVIEISNASRTLLYNIHDREWDPVLLERMEVPESILPAVVPSSGRIASTAEGVLGNGRVPISGAAGDQQAALFGQACFDTGMSKNTYGTGSFVLTNIGANHGISERGLLTTIAWGIDGDVNYALEGSIFVTGAAIQWLRDGLGIIDSASEAGPLAESVPDSGGVYFVPALVGLGAPHWDPYARGLITGITRGTTRAHLTRAAIEAMAFQTKDVVDAMVADSGVPLAELRVDGGAAVMDLLCSFQADLLGVPVIRPAITETTAMGAAFLAGIAEGVWESTDHVATQWKVDRVFEPKMSEDERETRYAEWKRAVDRSRGGTRAQS